MKREEITAQSPFKEGKQNNTMTTIIICCILYKYIMWVSCIDGLSTDGLSVKRPSNAMTKSAFSIKWKTIIRAERIRTLRNKNTIRADDVRTTCIWSDRCKIEIRISSFFLFCLNRLVHRPSQSSGLWQWLAITILYLYLTNWTRFAYFFSLSIAENIRSTSSFFSFIFFDGTVDFEATTKKTTCSPSPFGSPFFPHSFIDISNLFFPFFPSSGWYFEWVIKYCRNLISFNCGKFVLAD